MSIGLIVLGCVLVGVTLWGVVRIIHEARKDGVLGLGIFSAGMALAIGLTATALVLDSSMAWNARRPAQVCKVQGGIPDRLLFDSTVVCLPRYRGSDSLYVTGVTR